MSVPTTPNYGLKKPDGTEKMTPAQFNYNADIIDTELYKKRIITGIAAPTSSTVGIVGQAYLNTTDCKKYTCTAISGSAYTWSLDVPEQTYLKLMDVTTTANAQQVDLNVSSIDFTKYSMIQVFATIKAAPENTALNLFARINGGGAFMRSLDDASLNGQNYVGIGYANQNTDPASSMKLEFFGFPDVLTAAYMMHIHSSGVYYYNGFKLMEHFGLKDFAANQSLTAINFVTDNSNVYIKAGSKFKIYGVKK